ncbi:hypothetical protein DXG01_004920 [Tephrocybe rancida]|nr:hypothetical protein DXG01_004920 [Tephrocybe rancida]
MSDYESSSSVEERDVLVHQISPGDSLAGVSLKYGISLAELRRANHLWASDSIHLRTQLYIPIDKASRLKSIAVDNLINITPEEELVDVIASGSVHTEGFDLQTSRPSDTETIRRVPVSHLSFFPPPVAKPIESPRSSEEHAPSTTTIHHTRYTSLPSNSLTSLLTSLPIAASTRDTIIARLSFDSVSSSYSDAEIEADSHELDDVSVGSSSDYHDNEPPSTATLITPKATHRAPSFRRRSRSPNSPKLSHARHPSSSLNSYIPSRPEIRTVQMEPSPDMQLPLSSGKQMGFRGKPSNQPNLLDADMEIQRTV